MPTIQVRNVPDDVHRILRRRAGEAGQSLQQYLLARFVEEARKPSLEEVLNRVRERSGGTLPLAEAARAVREERGLR